MSSPDPHFKKAKHKWRIVNETLLAEYAWVLGEGGRLYLVTDVRDLFDWMTRHLAAHPLFRRLGAEEQAGDAVVPRLFESTEEGQKVGNPWIVASILAGRSLCSLILAGRSLCFSILARPILVLLD